MMPKFRVVVVLLLMLLATSGSLTSLAQLPVITFEVITSKEGLPSNTVLSATRDQSGFMWFGTRLCPVRYDGTAFKKFHRVYN